VTTPRDPRDSRDSGLPPHLDPRGRKGPPPRVTNAYRQAARGGPAPAGPGGPGRPGQAGPGRPEPSEVRPATQRRRGKRVARILSWVALSMAVLVLLSAAGLSYAFNHYYTQISKIDVFGGLPESKRPPAAKRNAQNFLLVGSDSRDGANGQGTQGTGSEFVTGQRSDTVILIHLFGSSEKAQLVSFPRDSYVEIPAFTNPKTKTTRSAHFGKLNSAFSEGGAPLLIATIENLTRVRINHFLQVDFTGFKGMVNKLGGVDVCLTKPAKDSFSGIDLSAGNHHISGDVALAFVRQRHGLANGDIDRIARQQQFIGSLVHKVLSAGTLLDPFKLNDFLDVATSSLKADKGLTGNDLKNLAFRLKSFNSGGVLFTTVPISDISGRRNGASVVLLDDTQAAVMFGAIQRDEVPGTPATAKPGTPAVPLVVAPANVRVSVFNGSGINGLGRKAASDIAAVGFQTVGIAQTRGTGATRTTIYYGPTKADSARTLQAAIPGSVLQADTSLGRTLELVVGSTYKNAQKVTVTKVTPSASPAPGTAAPVKTAQDNPCTT
jgi:LCP family protein required for cell wall assembly